MLEPTSVQHAHNVYGRIENNDKKPKPTPPPAVTSSWMRCASDYKLDPVRFNSPRVLDRGLMKERFDAHAQLIDIARAEMDALSDQIAGSGYALLLADANGVILTQKIDPGLEAACRGAGLIVGADWSEQYEGTNGIGTCIAEGRPVTIHRNDHFRARHIGLSCTGAPIRDVTGELLAVLDASSVGAHDTRSSQSHTMALVNMSAKVIEKCLFLRRFQGYRLLRFHSRAEFVNLLHDGAIALAEDGSVLAVDDTAAALLPGHDRRSLIGCNLQQLFETDEATLARQSAVSPQSVWPLRERGNGRRYFASLHVPRESSSHTQLLMSPGAATERGRRTAAPAREQLIRIERPLRPASGQVLDLDAVCGSDATMLRNARCARRIAASQVSVLIHGATGSGKEAFARALHLASPRADMPFVAVNCAAIPESLIESELFGYRAGAFTGARKEGMRGRIQQASGGTLFLDEIGDMPLQQQTRLLRVLEEQQVTPLGSDQSIPVNLRVLAASHRDLRDMIADGSFREDLYYRLNGIKLSLPRLAERSDREELIRYYLGCEALDDEPVLIERQAFALLMDYAWPGNIRELRNVARTALAICEKVIRVADLPSEVRETASAPQPAAASGPLADPVAEYAELSAANDRENPLQAAERLALMRSIDAHHWNMTNTAKALGMSRNTLYRKLRQHGIDVSRARGAA